MQKLKSGQIGSNSINKALDELERLDTYTVANLPATNQSRGKYVFVSDGAGGQPSLAYSDGTSWKRILLGAAIEDDGSEPEEPEIVQADSPRLILIGPSTGQRNSNGTQDNPRMYGLAATGPYMWAMRYGMRVDHRITFGNDAPYWLGDNYSREGAEFEMLDDQVDAVVADYAGVSNKWVVYAPGRNSIQNGILPNDYIAEVQSAINKLVAGGFTEGTNKILLEGVWKKSSLYGSPWDQAGAARTTSDQVNVLMKQLADNTPGVIFIDLQTGMADPDSPIGNPYSGTTVADYTHYQTKGAQRAGKLIKAQLDPYLVPKTYPEPITADNKFPAFTGTAGTLANNATGTVLTGYEVAKEAAANPATVVASIQDVDGKSYQRITISDMGSAAELSQSALFRLQANAAFTHGKPAGTLMAMRCRIKVQPTTALIGLSARLTDLGTNGRQVSAIALPYAQGQSHQAAQAGPALSSPVWWYDATEGLDLWLDSALLAVVGGSTIRPLIAVRYGPNADTIVADIGEWQTYVVQ